MKLRIKEIMQERGVTSIALASKTGLSKNTISNLINGKTMPSIDTLNDIAAKLNVPLWQLFTELQPSSDFTALIKKGDSLYSASSVEELEALLQKIR